jgi:hypothetical protein
LAHPQKLDAPHMFRIFYNTSTATAALTTAEAIGHGEPVNEPERSAVTPAPAFPPPQSKSPVEGFAHARLQPHGPPPLLNQLFQYHPLHVLKERAAAGLIGISIDVLRRMRRAGEGPRHVKISPGRIGYRLQDIRDWQEALPSEGCVHRGGRGRRPAQARAP